MLIGACNPMRCRLQVHHPIAAAFATLQEPANHNASHYNNTADIFMFDDYPCRCSPGWHPQPGLPFAGDDFEQVWAPFPSPRM